MSESDLLEILRWVYQLSCDALMSDPQRPREARAKREQALVDINKKLKWYFP